MATSHDNFAATLEFAGAILAHPVTHTLMGVVLGWGIAYWSLSFESRQREQSMLKALHFEVDSNRTRLEFLAAHVARELQILKEHKSITIPMPMLSDALWQQFLTEIPDQMLNDPKGFHSVSTFYESVRIINERLLSREAYRTSNGAMSNYEKILATHNEFIVAAAEVALKEVDAALYEIKRRITGPAPVARLPESK